MRDTPSVGMVRIFNNAILKKMKTITVDPQMGNVSEKYYFKKHSAYIQRVDRTLSTDGTGTKVRHFYCWKEGRGDLTLCETEKQMKTVIIKLSRVEREYFFDRYLLRNICNELFFEVNFENPEIFMSSIEELVDYYLDSRYHNYDHIASFTAEKIIKWMAEDRKENSSYNYIRARMINQIGGLERQSATVLRL